MYKISIFALFLMTSITSAMPQKQENIQKSSQKTKKLIEVKSLELRHNVVHEKIKAAACLLESLDASIKKAVVNNKISNTSPFFLAINCGQMEMVKLLIQHGADIHETAHPENIVDAREGFNGHDFALRQMLMEIDGDNKKEQKYAEIARFLYILMASESPTVVPPQSQKDTPNIIGQAAQQRDTRKLYVMMHSKSIKDHLRDAKNVQELNLSVLVDDQGKTVLEHAIENNDAQFVQMHAKTLSNEQRQIALRYAATRERPRVVLALVPREANESDEWALKRYFYGIQDLCLSEYKAYQDALALIKQYRKNHVALICSKILRALPADVQTHVAEMLNPTMCIREDNCIQVCMHPQLEQAIIVGDNKKGEKLIAEGWLTDEHNSQGIDALSLAAHHGHLSIVKQLIKQIPFIQEEQKNKLKQSAESQVEYFNKRLKYDPSTSEKVKLYNNIAQAINAAWPNQAQDNALIHALYHNRTGDFMHALGRGANPNVRNERGLPVAFLALLTNNTVFLKTLIDTKKLNPQTMVKDSTGKDCPLLFWAIEKNLPNHAKMLLDAGFDPNTPEGWGNPIAWSALQRNPCFLKMLIDTKKLNPQTTARDPKGKALPLLTCAIINNKPDHAKLLLDGEFDPNARSDYGNPIAWYALFEDPIFLKMLIDTKKLNPQIMAKDSTGKALPLLTCAIINNKPDHAKLLLDGWFDPNARCGYGHPIAWYALFEDPIFLKMLIDTKKLNPQTMVKDSTGKALPLLTWAVINNKPDHAKLLLDGGFDPNARSDYGNPIAWNALFQDPVFLKMLIAKKEFNMNVMIADDDGKEYSLLWWARYKKKPFHEELLRQAGAIETSCCIIM